MSAVFSCIGRSCIGAGLLGLMLAASAHAAPPATVAGTYALPDGKPQVSATLAVTPGVGAAAGMQVLDVALARLGDARSLARYDVELGKRLHVIAVSDDFRVFLHEHAGRPGADGHFRVAMRFPKGGAWHVYADAVPSGLGQQVMRFDISLDPAGTPPTGTSSSAPSAAPQPTGLVGRDGRYGVRFDALGLRAGQETQLTLHVLRDGKPAPDLLPFLGVAAHAVLISAADLTYVHVHAAPAALGAMQHGGMAGMPGMDAPLPDAKLPADLVLHITAPEAGAYLLWLQFSAGGHVRTVPFVVAVA